MKNIFREKSSDTYDAFSWSNLGDIKEGRQNLGESMPVWVYRLMHFSILDVLLKELGDEAAHELFHKAGCLAGSRMAAHMLDMEKDFNSFVSQLQNCLRDLKIGILRVEEFHEDTGFIRLTISEDLDCSGLPNQSEVICHYGAGFVQGILQTYTDQEYVVQEIDCWANGDRVCRFEGYKKGDE